MSPAEQLELQTRQLQEAAKQIHVADHHLGMIGSLLQKDNESRALDLSAFEKPEAARQALMWVYDVATGDAKASELSLAVLQTMINWTFAFKQNNQTLEEVTKTVHVVQQKLHPEGFVATPAVFR